MCIPELLKQYCTAAYPKLHESKKLWCRVSGSESRDMMPIKGTMEEITIYVIQYKTEENVHIRLQIYCLKLVVLVVWKSNSCIYIYIYTQPNKNWRHHVPQYDSLWLYVYQADSRHSAPLCALHTHTQNHVLNYTWYTTVLLQRWLQWSSHAHLSCADLCKYKKMNAALFQHSEQRRSTQNTYCQRVITLTIQTNQPATQYKMVWQYKLSLMKRML